MALSADSAFPVMEQLLACAQEQLEARDISVPPNRMIQPGNLPVLDHAGAEDCSDCDEMIVWLEISYPIGDSGFPDQDETGTCRNGLAHVIHIGIFRAAPLADDDGDPPTPAEQTAAARSQADDREALRAAVKCCAAGREYVLGAYSTYGPEGGVMGGEWATVIGGELD